MSKADNSSYYVVEVIPIVRGLPKPTLSYFTRQKTSLGSFVRITVRNTEALGLVIKVQDAREEKSSLKSSSFALKKLSKADGDISISPSFIEAAEATAAFYASSTGSVLATLIPKLFLESPELAGKSMNTPEFRLHKEPLLVQLGDEERYREYKAIIRGSFARGRSVLFIAPTHEDVLRAQDLLSKGIIEYTYTTSRKSPKALREVFLEAQQQPHPILMITTPSFISFDRSDLETIILERENSRSYRTLSRPYIDIKTFAENLARISGKTLIMGDAVLSMKSLWGEKQGKYAELSPLKWKMHYESRTKMIDMKSKDQIEKSNDREFKIFSPDMIHMIENAVAERRKVFLFGARKGLAPSTVCKDCGTVLPCENCGAPLVLHEKNGSRVYLCHACGASRDAETRCPHCQSWNLVPLGIGIDRIKHEIGRLFPDVPLYVLDKEHTATTARARLVAKDFASQKGGILIGTELALAYLEKVPYVGVVSLDSLFSIPDFSIHERIFYLLAKILEKSEREAIIQTRNIGKDILTFAAKGDILGFFRSEIREREELRYPPFTLFIKVITDGGAGELEKKAAFLRGLFVEYGTDFLKERGIKSGKTLLSMIMRLPRNTWPDRDILKKLSLLPPGFLIKVDPDSLF